MRFGMSGFYPSLWIDPKGGYVKVPIADWSSSQEARVTDFIDDLAADSYTPLAESLYNIYRYFQSRTSPTLGKDETTEFPGYNLELDGDMTLMQAHLISDEVELQIRNAFVGAEVLIHQDPEGLEEAHAVIR